MENNLDLTAASFFLKPGKRISYLLIIGPSDQNYDAVALIQFTTSASGSHSRSSDWPVFQGCGRDIHDAKVTILQETIRDYGTNAAKFVRKILDGYYCKEWFESMREMYEEEHKYDGTGH
jgi:hypothetical protein